MTIQPDHRGEQAAKLLAQANLHRMRKQWDEAMTCCMQALYHTPDDSRAHALLGDIYAEQRRADEAIQWYCMSLDIRPESQSVRDKLSKLVNARRHQIVRSIDPAQPLSADDPLPKTWLDDLTERWSAPEYRRQRLTGIIAGVGLIGLFAVPLVMNSTQKSPGTGVFTAGPTITAPALVLQQVSGTSKQPPAASPAQSAEQPAIAPTQPAQNATGTTPAVAAPQTTGSNPTGSSALMRDTSDQTLTSGLQSDANLQSAGIAVTDAIYDPASSGVTVTFSVADRAPNGVADRVLRDAALVARAALDRPEAGSAASCTVRCLMQDASGAQTPDTAAPPTLIFTGTTTRDTSPDTAGAEKTQPSQPAPSFTRTWWSPTIGQSS